MTNGRPLITKRRAAGEPRGTVVLVHGTLDHSGSFRAVAGALRDWTVVGYDRRGWAGSRALGDSGDLDRQVRDLLDILATLDRAVLLGHSYGGLVALCAAAGVPDRVEAVVAYEPPVRWLPWWPAEPPWDRVVLDAEPAMAATALRTAVLAESGLRQFGLPAGHVAADSAALLAEMRHPSLDEPSFDPADLTMPVVTAAGSRSLPHHVEVAKRLADLVPHGRFTELPMAAHAAHVTHPGEFAALVTARP